ncbi:MarR family transcriptional regulator [Nonomuraea sp. NPDC049158]|uniref:MarR family winged helix-turn-helix transcriptional regulator n=1 Tax=Nonomuraea sp. NPDC049158 TaxID=3155649 RepID=UPI0033F0EEB1
MTSEHSAEPDLQQAPLPYLVSIAGNVLNSRWNALLSQEHGVSVAGMNVLLALSRGSGTHTEIARRCWVHVSTLTGIVDTLARDHLVDRLRDTVDRRKVLLVLTPRGKKIIERVGGVLSEAPALAPSLPDPEHEAIIRKFLIDTILFDEREATRARIADTDNGDRRQGR